MQVYTLFFFLVWSETTLFWARTLKKESTHCARSAGNKHKHPAAHQIQKSFTQVKTQTISGQTRGAKSATSTVSSEEGKCNYTFLCLSSITIHCYYYIHCTPPQLLYLLFQSHRHLIIGTWEYGPIIWIWMDVGLQIFHVFSKAFLFINESSQMENNFDLQIRGLMSEPP